MGGAILLLPCVSFHGTHADKFTSLRKQAVVFGEEGKLYMDMVDDKG
jgi:hypothetical protein